MSGRVYLVGAGPGDPELLTLKAKRCLEESDVVIYDRLVSDEVLAFIPEHVKRVYVGKAPLYHTISQAEIESLLVDEASRGLIVTRLKGGDPFVYGRGAEEAETLGKYDIPFEIVPGISSAVAVPAYAGIPLTHREFSSGFHVVTGHECVGSRGTPWSLLAETRQTVVVLMGLGHIRSITEKLTALGRESSTPVAVIRSGTTRAQEVIVRDLATIADAVEQERIQPPAVIVIGEVVRLHEHLDWFTSLPVPETGPYEELGTSLGG